jgi:hypothetical protein
MGLQSISNTKYWVTVNSVEEMADVAGVFDEVGYRTRSMLTEGRPIKVADYVKYFKSNYLSLDGVHRQMMMVVYPSEKRVLPSYVTDGAPSLKSLVLSFTEFMEAVNDET